jgi:hypothetical protein
MKSGHSFIAQKTNAGYGLPCVGVLARLLPLFQGITVPKPVPNCGKRFQQVTNVVTRLVISGMLTAKYFLKQHIARLAKVQVNQSYGALELYPASTVSSLCSQNAVLL